MDVVLWLVLAVAVIVGITGIVLLVVTLVDRPIGPTSTAEELDPEAFYGDDGRDD